MGAPSDRDDVFRPRIGRRPPRDWDRVPTLRGAIARGMQKRGG